MLLKFWKERFRALLFAFIRADDGQAGLLRGKGFAHNFHPYGSEFEFRDLAIRIKRRVGQNIGRCLDKGKGQEHHVGANRPVRSRHDVDTAASGCQPDHVTRTCSKPLQRGWVQ